MLGVPVPPEVVLFDLDGTLSDSAPGIIASLQLSLAENGVEPLTVEEAYALLGPPFYESLPPIIGEAKLPAVLAAYRQHYASGMFNTATYPGAGELVDALHDAGTTLAVATSKPEPYAVLILEHLGFADRFEQIVGDTMDGERATKALVIGEALSRLKRRSSAGVVMVGDRSHDVAGALAHTIPCLGAGWGYGLPGELEEAGAAGVFAHPAELTQILLP